MVVLQFVLVPSGGDRMGRGVDRVSVGEEAAAVLERHHPVAQETPTLFGVGSDDRGGSAATILWGRTARLVLARKGHGGLAVAGRFI
jgi:hypothetical protein